MKKLKKKESVDEAYDIWAEDGSFGYTMTGIVEAEYGGRKVKLGKPMQGDVKKFKVYVKNPKGNVVKVNFGHGGSSAKGKTMKIRKSNPKPELILEPDTIVIILDQDIRPDIGAVKSGKIKRIIKRKQR